MEQTIAKLIEDTVDALGRGDLYRQPIVAFSDAADKRYEELKNLIGDWHQSPGEMLDGAKSVISYFVPFTKEVVAEPKTAAAGSFKWSEAYQEINRHFNVINEAIAAYLSEQGFESMAIRPTHTYNPKDLKSIWSHRSAAVIAGLGTFGANNLVITEKGSGGRFCTVITTAELEPSRAVQETKCLFIKNGSCGLCFKACPVKALEPGVNRKFDCQDELNKNEAKLMETTDLTSADTCGKCISVCPFAFIE